MIATFILALVGFAAGYLVATSIERDRADSEWRRYRAFLESQRVKVVS